MLLTRSKPPTIAFLDAVRRLRTPLSIMSIAKHCRRQAPYCSILIDGRPNALIFIFPVELMRLSYSVITRKLVRWPSAPPGFSLFTRPTMASFILAVRSATPSVPALFATLCVLSSMILLALPNPMCGWCNYSTCCFLRPQCVA